MRIEYPKLESVITDLSLNQNYNTMGKTKELFESMMQGMIEGISIEQQMTKRMVDDEYRMSIYKKEKEKETKPTIMTLGFGKYKGQQFEKTPKSYQDWLFKQDWFKLSKQDKPINNYYCHHCDTPHNNQYSSYCCSGCERAEESFNHFDNN